MAYACTGPYNNTTAPEGVCAPGAWLVHGGSLALGLFIMCFLIALANDLTLLSTLTALEATTAAEINAKAMENLLDPNSSATSGLINQIPRGGSSVLASMSSQ